MDFRDNPTQAEFRAEIRAFIAAHRDVAPTIDELEERMVSRSETPKMTQWRELLGERGWAAPGWPKDYGGAGMTIMEQAVLLEEFAEARVGFFGGTGNSGSGPNMVGPTIMLYGNEEQRRYFLPRILKFEIRWCQGFSEPEAGSDLASLRTRAVRDGDDFVLNGQKIWTSRGHVADWMYMIARTDPDVPKHKGITYFLLDMKSPGITVRPLVNLAGHHHFNEVFFDNVRVPATNVVGEVNRGWYIATTTLDFERAMLGTVVSLRQDVEQYTDFVKEHGYLVPESQARMLRHELADRWIEAHVARTLGMRVISMKAAGMVPNSEASIAKLFNTELAQRIARTGARVLGMFGQVRGARAPLGGEAAEDYLRSVSSTIAGGTSEIQRGIIAGRGLGLPR